MKNILKIIVVMLTVFPTISHAYPYYSATDRTTNPYYMPTAIPGTGPSHHISNIIAQDNRLIWTDTFYPAGNQIKMYDTNNPGAGVQELTGARGGDSLYGNYLVYNYFDGNTAGVYLYDLNTKLEYNINQIIRSSHCLCQNYPAISPYQQNIAFPQSSSYPMANYPSYSSNVPAYYNPVAQATPSCQQYNSINPATSMSKPNIWQNKVVWSDNSNGAWDAYMYDLGNRQYQRLTDGTQDVWNPQINNNRVGWVDSSLGQNRNRVMNYDLGNPSRGAYAISEPGPINPNMQMSSDGAMWSLLGNTLHDLLFYNINKGDRKNIRPQTVINNPSIYNTKITYYDNYGNIYLYDEKTDSVTEIYQNTGIDSTPVLTDDHLFWKTSTNDGDYLYLGNTNTTSQPDQIDDIYLEENTTKTESLDEPLYDENLNSENSSETWQIDNSSDQQLF